MDAPPSLPQAVFNVLHNEAGFSHEALVKFPEALTARRAMECKHRLQVWMDGVIDPKRPTDIFEGAFFVDIFMQAMLYTVPSPH